MVSVVVGELVAVGGNIRWHWRWPSIKAAGESAVGLWDPVVLAVDDEDVVCR